MNVLLFPHEREALARQIEDDIDAYTAQAYNDGHRNHLGASLIGDACNRRLWYHWRWVMFPRFSGRMQRLFNRGHKEEARFIEWLRAIGFGIWEGTEDGKQFRVSAVQGHFGGSLDGIGLAPQVPKYAKLYAVGPLLTEYKTFNEKTYKELVRDGVKKAKPRHFAQMSTYGRKYGYKYAIYCAICKNDDALRIEIVELDWNVGADLERKAEEIITAMSPPRRISEYSTHMECKFCDFAGICHKGDPYEVNCRSCAFASPAPDGQWYCGGWKTMLTLDTIKVGCPQWKPIGRNN